MTRITFKSTVILIAIVCFVILILASKHCDVCFSAPVMALKVIACGFAIILITIASRKGFKAQETIAFNIESLPLTETDEACDGTPFAGEGIVDTESGWILTSPYTNTPCVYYHSVLEQYVRRGKSSSWETIENKAQFVPFHFKDRRGGMIDVDLNKIDSDFSHFGIEFNTPSSPNSFLHNPKNSEIDAQVTMITKEYIEKTSSRLLGIPLGNDTRYRKSEFVLTPGTNVFVYGAVGKNDDGELVLRESDECPLIISRKTRDQYVDEFYRGASIIYLSYFLIAFGYTIIMLALNYFTQWEAPVLYTLLIAGNAFILGSLVFTFYNRLITLRNRAENAQSDIEVELKRRSDLIPNIAEAVKGYAQHEQEVNQFVAESRAATAFSKDIQKEARNYLPALSVVVEKYPDLKASDNFQSLMRTLIETEQRIAYSREFYNRSVRKFNTLMEEFPFSLIVKTLKLKEMDYLSIARGEDAVPTAAG